LADRFLFEISEGWALGHDKLQWILLKREKSARQGKKSHPSFRWRAVSFIASTKQVLLRVVAEKGIQPTLEGWAALNALPETFTAWHSQLSKLVKSA
jgi:hypothetical protein